MHHKRRIVGTLLLCLALTGCGFQEAIDKANQALEIAEDNVVRVTEIAEESERVAQVALEEARAVHEQVVATMGEASEEATFTAALLAKAESALAAAKLEGSQILAGAIEEMNRAKGAVDLAEERAAEMKTEAGKWLAGLLALGGTYIPVLGTVSRMISNRNRTINEERSFSTALIETVEAAKDDNGNVMLTKLRDNQLNRGIRGKVNHIRKNGAGAA